MPPKPASATPVTAAKSAAVPGKKNPSAPLPPAPTAAGKKTPVPAQPPSSSSTSSSPSPAAKAATTASTPARPSAPAVRAAAPAAVASMSSSSSTQSAPVAQSLSLARQQQQQQQQQRQSPQQQPPPGRHLPDVTKVQVTSKECLTPTELRQDLQRLTLGCNAKPLLKTLDTIVATATSVSRQQDLLRLLSRNESSSSVELIASVLGTSEKAATVEPTEEHSRFWISSLCAFVGVEAHSKIAAAYLGVSKQQHSQAATHQELEGELRWFFATFDPKHLQFAKTIASHFHNNTAMQTGLSRFLYQDLLWATMGVAREEEQLFPYLQTVDVALGVGKASRLHESWVRVLEWNEEKKEQVRRMAGESLMAQRKKQQKKRKRQQQQQSENKNGNEALDFDDDDDDDDDNDDDEVSTPDGTGAAGAAASSAEHQASNSASSNINGAIALTASRNINFWKERATACIVLTAEFSLRQQRRVSATSLKWIPPLYRDTFDWLAMPWIETPLEFKLFPKPFVLFDLWALDTIHRLTEFRQFCIDQLHSFLLEEAGAFTVIEDARRSSEQVLRKKAAQQQLVVARALEMLVATQMEHRKLLEQHRAEFLGEAKYLLAYSSEYKQIRSRNLFAPVDPSLHQRWRAMKVIVEENSREIQRIGKAVSERQRVQMEAAKRSEALRLAAESPKRNHSLSGAGRYPTLSSSTSLSAFTNRGGAADAAEHIAKRRSAAASLHIDDTSPLSSTTLRRIVREEKLHRAKIAEVLGVVSERERAAYFVGPAAAAASGAAVDPSFLLDDTADLDNLVLSMVQQQENVSADCFDHDDLATGEVFAAAAQTVVSASQRRGRLMHHQSRLNAEHIMSSQQCSQKSHRSPRSFPSSFPASEQHAQHRPRAVTPTLWRTVGAQNAQNTQNVHSAGEGGRSPQRTSTPGRRKSNAHLLARQREQQKQLQLAQWRKTEEFKRVREQFANLMYGGL